MNLSPAFGHVRECPQSGTHSFVRAGQAGLLSEAFPQRNVRGMRTDVTIMKSSCG